MAVPISQVITVAKYAISNTLKGKKRYPLVMMLEPLFQCNLACSGCGKIQYPKEILAKRMPKEKAWAAAEECGAHDREIHSHRIELTDILPPDSAIGFDEVAVSAFTAS